jgi:hypothetical protein
VLTALSLRADGIAVSTDGLVWTNGAGNYGRSWDQAGIGVSVPQGGTFYVKYNSPVSGASLHFADHGRKTGVWNPVGPRLAGGIGAHPGEPVMLKISAAGTPACSVTWMNGRESSGIWSGPPAPGPYDLALHDGAQWIGPAIVVTDAPRKPGFWSSLFGPRRPTRPDDNRIVTVPDIGSSTVLFLMMLFTLAFLRRITR